MPFHPSSAVSVAAMLTAAAVVAGYHFTRGHRSGRRSRRAGRSTRPQAWLPTVRVMTAVLLLLLTLFAAAYNAGS